WIRTYLPPAIVHSRGDRCRYKVSPRESRVRSATEKETAPKLELRGCHLWSVWFELVAGQGGLLREQVLHVDAQPFGDAAAIGRVGFQEVCNLFFLNVFGHRLHAADYIVDQPLPRIRLHQAEEVSGLREVVIAWIEVMVVAIDRAGDRPRTLAILRILLRPV